MAGPYDLIVIGTGPGGYVVRHPRGPARPEGGGGREARHATAAPASTSAASPPRRCCSLRDATRRPATASPPWASRCTPKLDLAKMLAFKDEGVKGNVDGVAFLFKKNKIDAIHGTGTHPRPGQGRRRARQRRQAASSRPRASSSPPARTSPGCPASTSTSRRSSPRPAPCAPQGAEAPAGHRRRRDRPGARLGLAAARREVTSSSSSTASCPASTPRSASSLQRILDEAGHELQARRARSRASPRTANGAQGHHRAGRGRRRGDGRGRRRAGRHRPRALHRRPRPRGGRRRSSTTRKRIVVDRRTSRPTCPASTPSAT